MDGTSRRRRQAEEEEKDSDRQQKEKRKQSRRRRAVSSGGDKRRRWSAGVGGYVPGKAGVVCPRGVKGVCCIANWWSLLNC